MILIYLPYIIADSYADYLIYYKNYKNFEFIL